MLIKRPRTWELSENLVTPENVFLNRRAFLRGTTASIAGAATLAVAGCGEAADNTEALAGGEADLTAKAAELFPYPANNSIPIDRPVTDEEVSSTYNNFYEFGSHKRISRAAEALVSRPWKIEITGEVDTPITLDVDQLIAQMPLEERIYRHRCVEAWSMTVPWSGFPLAALVDFAKPKSTARYLKMQTFMQPSVASGQKQSWYPWPYTEGLTMAEARNELAFMATGIYGKPLGEQFGAPIRLAVPWKYGFKSIKSIVKFEFTGKKPTSFWEEIAPNEYGFWANVNPDVPHPRWSQATEEVLGTGRRVPTLMFNGYEEQVAGLYKGLEGQNLYR